MKVCSECQQDKAEHEFYLLQGKPMSRCKECHKTYCKAWAKLNREKIQQTREKYGKANYRTRNEIVAQTRTYRQG